MPESSPPIALAGLDMAELRNLSAARKLPPVDKWDPQHCGDSEMRIGRDGTWYHQGQPIRRPEMVRLFSTILRREPDGRHVLVTPVEKLDIEVETTAFRAIEMTSEGSGRQRQIALKLDTGDLVLVDADHPLRVVSDDGPSPRVAVRHGLEAELARPVYYELAEIALAENSNGVWSGGCFFPFTAE